MIEWFGYQKPWVSGFGGRFGQTRATLGSSIPSTAGSSVRPARSAVAGDGTPI
jgi:hypothetical protein